LCIPLTIGVQDGLVELIDDIGGHLEYFQELEQATRMLNHPGESLIFEADFLYMVERVDICIDFLKGHVRIRSISITVRSYSFLSSDISRKQKFTS
jgi:conserved oligomeric Golgi complex subunit 3